MSDSVLRKKLLSEGIVILNGRYRLFVSSDALEAYLIKEGPGPELLWQDVPSVVQDLKNLGITYGLLQEPEEERGGKLVVALCKGPQRGQDARVEFIIDLSRGPLKEEGPDRVIYRELNTIVCVKAGQPVARKIPPGSGSPGMNVFGEPLAPFPGKDVHFVYGPGLEADELLLKAKHDGVFLLEGEKPVVSPVYVLDSDLDWSVGNIHFFGEK
ncbi:flagellar assembly protein A, partial [Thermosulfuriphilus sp.]